MECKVDILEGVVVAFDNNNIKVTGPKGEIAKELYHPWIKMQVKEKEVIINSIRPKSGQMDKKLLNTFRSHVKNLILGVTHGYISELKICSGHFPMNVSIEGDKVTIKNFFGEKIPRKTTVMEGATAKLEGDMIIIKGLDKEVVGQSAARIEQATQIRKRDRRRFQDGCHIVTRTKLEDE